VHSRARITRFAPASFQKAALPGLAVPALGGQPGVHSARYAGEGAGGEENNRKLLEAMKGMEEDQRVASFICVLVLISPEGKEEVFEGDCQGLILNESRGDGGFGYDPLFYYPPKKKTFAQIPREEKNLVSHRGLALKKLLDYLKS